MKTRALRKYQDGVGSLAGWLFRCFGHDVAAQEAHSTSTGAHGRGLGSEGTSSLFHCSTSRAAGVFSLVSATAHGYRTHTAKDCLGQAKEPHILASSCHGLERNRMEAKISG